MKHLLLLPLLFCASLTACGSTSEGGAGSGDPNSANGTGLCGTNAQAITYSGQASGVLNTLCVSGCHVAGGSQSSLPLDTFANASATLKANGGSQVVDTSFMPPQGSTAANDNQKCIIKNWVSGGYTQ